MIIPDSNSASSGYDIPYSFVQEYNSTRFVSKTWGGFGGTNPTNTKATVSYWHKRASSQASVGGGCWKLLDTQNSEVSIMAPGGTYDGSIYCAGQNESLFKLVTTAKFRDTSAWYHVVASFDSTQSTASDRVKLYVNGVRITDFSTANYPAQNSDFRHISENSQHHVGHNANAGKPYGYFADMYFIWDQAKDATDFGEFDLNGIWRPIEYTGTFGTYGYYWDFSNTSNYAEDQSGNGNNGTSTNTTAAMQSTDTPTNNFCIMNSNSRTNGNIKTQEGGTKVTTDGGSGWCSMNATMGVQNGKWYWEMRFENSPDNTNTVFIGIAGASDTYIPHIQGGYYLGNVASTNSIGWYFVNGGIYNGNGSWTGPGYGDIAMVALDMDNGKLYLGVNGTWGNSSNPANNTNGIPIGSFFGVRWPDFVLPSVSVYQGKRINSMNFGGYKTYSNASTVSDANGYGAFEYTPPSGFYALCSKNLAEFG